MSYTGKQWTVTHNTPVTDMAAFVARLRGERGLEAEGVFAEYGDPHIYPDMAKAVARVQRAIAEGETIAVFGDYDCDGVTSTALLLRLLQRHGSAPVIRLPHRVRDGYGIRPHHSEAFADSGVSLLLTVDNGIGAHEAVERANARGIDVIILDHHHCVSAPAAFAVLHPALIPDWPGSHPSAAGVAYSFVRAYEKTDDWDGRAIDSVLAMMGTIADLVPLTHENRTIVQRGLRCVADLPDCPLRTLIARSCGDAPPESTDIAFRVAPRINAAGRMEDPLTALTAVMDGGPALETLDMLNALRQDETSRAMERALLELSSQDPVPSFICVASSAYAPGIVGLLAGKLTERFGRPSLAAHIDATGETCIASLRGPAGYDVARALRSNADVLTHFGGHAQAAGASFPLSSFIELAERLDADAALHLDPAALAPSLMIDGILSPDVIDTSLYGKLISLAPFGQGNPEPLFLVPGVALDRLRRVGSDLRHLQGRVGPLSVIGFGLGHLTEELNGNPVDLACRIGMNTWNGRTEAQLIVADVRPHQETRTQQTSHPKNMQTTSFQS